MHCAAIGIKGEGQEWRKKCCINCRWPREKGPRLHSITWLDHVISTHNEQHCLFKWPSIRMERFIHPCARTAGVHHGRAISVYFFSRPRKRQSRVHWRVGRLGESILSAYKGQPMGGRLAFH